MPEPIWTLESYIAHNEAKWLSQRDFDAERDRRYTEVKNAEEKALKIKEEADKTALGLQRDTQVYKDEKANELRSQIERERGSYATKDDLKGLEQKLDAKLNPIAEFVSGQQGRAGSVTAQRSNIIAIFGILGTLAGIIGTIVALVVVFKR